MSKIILVFSDGTGQIGGVRPDQRLSNIYKMYRAMRPGPSSPILPSQQVAFYDPGLGSGETGGGIYRNLRNLLDSAVGAGIDENIIDCYEKIISYYEPGDRVLLFGFSRGAYTVRAVANVMNLCGIPTMLPDGSPMPRYGPILRKIATDAVKFNYNHGAGYKRGEEPYFTQREEKGRRFRVKYGSSPTDGSENVQGNVQPTFIGVYDTVAALGHPWSMRLVFATFLAMTGYLIYTGHSGNWTIFHWGLLIAWALLTVWYVRVLFSQFKYFSPDEERPLRVTNPLHWYAILKNGHRAVWKKTNYDEWLDAEVGFARHALAIDEHRASFPRVEWGSLGEFEKNDGKKPEWLKQVWFAGCHSDIGGSYPEPESRLSDIALDWMVAELKQCVPDVQIREDQLVRACDPLALQHEETYILNKGPLAIKWKRGPRMVGSDYPLHRSVRARLKASSVPQVGEAKPYRPVQLSKHDDAKKYFEVD